MLEMFLVFVQDNFYLGLFIMDRMISLYLLILHVHFSWIRQFFIIVNFLFIVYF